MISHFGHEDAASASGGALEEVLGHLVTNREISRFLEEDNKPFLIGPKGTGKTLLLIKKALSKLQDSSIIVVPNNKDLPVDRLTTDSNPGQRFLYKTSEDQNAVLTWTALWKNAIYKAALYNAAGMAGDFQRHEGLHHLKKSGLPKNYVELASARASQIARELLGPPPYVHRRAPFYFYHDGATLLDDDPTSTAKRIREENGHLKDTLETLSLSTYIFIDNIDTYYETDPGLWLASTSGLMFAVRELRLELRHLHIFTSIRSDIYRQFKTEKRLQFGDYIAPLSYTRDELIQVFFSGISRLPDDLLSKPQQRLSDPWTAFFGDHSYILNQSTRAMESVKQLLLRHTLYRPRDIVSIGNRILGERRDAPLTAEAIRSGVTNAAKEIREAYYAEVEPSLPRGFDLAEFVRKFVPSNVLMSDNLRQLYEQYNKNAGDSCFDYHPFCILFRLGLLGYTKGTALGTFVWQFSRPGDVLATDETYHIPPAKAYGLHPILDEVIGWERLNRYQIVGHDVEFNQTCLKYVPRA